MGYKIFTAGKKGIFDITPFCTGDIIISSFREGKAGSIEFTVGRNLGGKFSFTEGDCVIFSIDDNILFKGFIFSKERNSDHFIKVTAYDQLRYLKNRNTYNYSFKTASEVVLMIIKDFGLDYAFIDNSQYVIGARIEENKSLFDIILNAADITYKNTGNRFILFDKAGKLYFKNENNLKLPLSLSIADNSIIDFYSKTDIDSDTFTQVKLFQKNKTKKIDKSIIIKSDEGIENFGILQYFKKIPDEYNDFQLKSCAENILKQKNRIKTTFCVKCLGRNNGEENIRAGNGIFIDSLDIGEETINGFHFIDKCVHTFSSETHTIEMYFEKRR